MPGNCSSWYLTPISSWILHDIPHRTLENQLGTDLIKILTSTKSNWKPGTLLNQNGADGHQRLWKTILRLESLAPMPQLSHFRSFHHVFLSQILQCTRVKSYRHAYGAHHRSGGCASTCTGHL